MMMRRFIPSFLRNLAAIAVLTFSLLSLQTAVAEKYAAIVIDADTHSVLHARNADDARYPASLTKVMTLYMLFDALKSGEVTLNEKLTVSRHAASQPPSNLRLRTGAKISVKDAINALINKSANDVAVVVAERLGGTERRFAQLMTVKAKSLGLEDTRFRNASGLPDSQQISTARDLAKLADAMLTDHADYYHYFSSTEFSWGRKIYKNHNALLKSVDGVDGIKTGYTRASGFNLMASAKRDGQRVIAVMLGGNTARARNSHVEALLEAAFTSLDASDPAEDARLTFAYVPTPVDPNGAAEPMLNGKPLRVIVAEGETDGIETTIDAPVIAPVKSAEPAAAPVEEVAELRTRETSSELTVAAYEARQFQLIH